MQNSKFGMMGGLETHEPLGFGCTKSTKHYKQSFQVMASTRFQNLQCNIHYVMCSNQHVYWARLPIPPYITDFSIIKQCMLCSFYSSVLSIAFSQRGHFASTSIPLLSMFRRVGSPFTQALQAKILTLVGSLRCHIFLQSGAL